MNRRRFALSATILWLVPAMALAEGSLGPELDVSQALREDTDLHVDILDASQETFVWTGKGRVEVFDPMGASIGRFRSGQEITPTMEGDYRIDLEPSGTGGVFTAEPVEEGSFGPYVRAGEGRYGLVKGHQLAVFFLAT